MAQGWRGWQGTRAGHCRGFGIVPSSNTGRQHHCPEHTPYRRLGDRTLRGFHDSSTLLSYRKKKRERDFCTCGEHTDEFSLPILSQSPGSATAVVKQQFGLSPPEQKVKPPCRSHSFLFSRMGKACRPFTGIPPTGPLTPLLVNTDQNTL